MRKKLKNLKHKSGHSENGAPRQLIDETVYREFMNNVGVVTHWDSQYSGWTNPSRPRDQAIFLRTFSNSGGPG